MNVMEKSLHIPVAGVILEADVVVPDQAARSGAVRARQRQRPAQPAQPLRRRRAAAPPAWPPAGRPAHPGEEQRTPRPRELRFDIGLLAGAPGGATDWLADAARDRGPPRRPVRRQHRRRGGAGRRGGAARRGRGGRLARRPARPGRRRPGRRPPAHPAHRRRRRRAGHRPEPRGACGGCRGEARWRSCPARRTCSRSRARWSRSPRLASGLVPPPPAPRGPSRRPALSDEGQISDSAIAVQCSKRPYRSATSCVRGAGRSRMASAASVRSQYGCRMSRPTTSR